MPFPYAYYQDNYNGPIHATTFKANGFISLPTAPIVASGNIPALGQTVLNFNTSGSNIVIDSLTDIVSGQLIFVSKMTTANSLTLKNISATGTGCKIYSSTGNDIVFPAGSLGGTFLFAIQDGALLKLFEIRAITFGDGSEAFPGISFASDPSTGFRKVLGGISVSLGGVEKFKIGTDIIAKNAILIKDGLSSALALAFENATTTGFYRKASGELALMVAGVEALSAEADGDVVIANKFKKITAPFKFVNSADVYTESRMGSLGVASSDAVIAANIPVNGIYSQGHVKTSGQFQGTATSALYADLAERYEADAVYPVGTIIEIGGVKEITIAKDPARPFAIISENPGFKLNSEAGSDETHPYVAMIGRTPCRILGKIKKGDPIELSGIPGVGCYRKYSHTYGPTLARALEDKLTEEEGLVMVVTKALI